MTMTFTEILKVYGWSLPVLAVLAATLSYSGAHLAAREKTLLSLNTSQGAEIGSLLTFILVFYMGLESSAGTVITSLVGACGGALTGGWLAARFQSRMDQTKGNALFALWILLFASTQILIASQPTLEAHFARSLVGDVSTLTNIDLLIISTACVLFILLSWRNKDKIMHSTFRQELMLRHPKSHAVRDHILFIALIAMSTWATGFLLTCALLFLPTTLLALRPTSGARRHIRLCIICAALGAPLGMLASLGLPHLPTVPIICFSTAALSICSTFFRKERLDGAINQH